MPRPHVVCAGRNSVDRKITGLARKRVIRVVEHDEACLAPRMKLVDDLQLRGLLEKLIERHHLAVVVEGSDSDDVSRSDIDDLVAMHRDVCAKQVQRAARDDSLKPWYHHAVVVLQLEPSLDWNRFSLPDVSDPDGSAYNAIARSVHATVHHGLTASSSL